MATMVKRRSSLPKVIGQFYIMEVRRIPGFFIIKSISFWPRRRRFWNFAAAYIDTLSELNLALKFVAIRVLM